MSDRRPPEPPPSPKAPKNMSPESGGKNFNWRVILFFTIAAAILFMAFNFYGKTGIKRINFEEYKKKHFSGDVYFKGKYEKDSEIYKKLNLNHLGDKFITKSAMEQGRTVWHVQGKFNYLDSRDLSTVESKKPFIAELNSPRSQDVFKDIPNNKLNSFEWSTDLQADKSKIINKLKLISPNSDTVTSITAEELRTLFYKNEVTNINVVKSSDSTGKTFIYGELISYAKLSNEALKKRALADKLPLTDKDIELGVKYVGFNMKNSVHALNDEQKAFITATTAKFDSIGAGIGDILLSFLPILLILLILFFLFRSQMKNAGKGAMGFGKSKAKLLNQEKNKITFKDVAGIQEAKEELYEIVDFLKGPKKFEVLGGNIPKGILMIGSPGTGKTLLAKAIAGEADVPFFSISGSDFVEMFVGVGASRVRDMFEQGKKNSPCIIFIDEIDAVGRHRGQGHGGGNDEREQTLNALLVEMDGFDEHSGVIIIAATNRPDVLDPALLRPGRFDRQVTVSLPDYKGREEILAVHAKKIKLAEGTDLSTISRGTPGFSGAELANLINEAALLAARQGLKEVTKTELEEARDKVRWGRERRSLAMSEKDKTNTAYHEAGHAICNLMCDHTDNLHKVTIIPRGPALGMAMFLPDEDKVNYREAELVDQLCVAMGGRVAEEIIFGDVTNGAMGDIRQATNIARKMVCEWGMSKNLGMVDYGKEEGQESYIGAANSYSEGTAQKIDSEIKVFIDEAYQRAMRMLTEKRDALELISQSLLEFETLNGEQIRDLLEKGVMDNPPQSPTPPEPPTAPSSEQVDAPPTKEEAVSNDELPPEVVGSPA